MDPAPRADAAGMDRQAGRTRTPLGRGTYAGRRERRGGTTVARVWGAALSGGGAPGTAAHLGLLEALAERGLLPDILVGASAGGIAAAMLGAGLTPSRALALWGDVARDPWALLPREALHAVDALLRPSPTPGLIDLAAFIHRLLPPQACTDVAEWSPGHGVVATDMDGGVTVLLHAGDPAGWRTAAAITATAALPGLIAGVRGPDGHLYQDGGLLDDDPVAACRRLGAERVLLVHIGAPRTVPGELSVSEVLDLSLTIGLGRLDAAANPAPADLRVDVAVEGGLCTLALWEADAQAGRTLALQALPSIRDLAGA